MDEDTFKILITSNLHMGYMENDEIRGEKKNFTESGGFKYSHNENIQGDDSFNTLEEILNIAVEEGIDLILVAGDFFHESEPSNHALSNTTRIIKRYTLGTESPSFTLLNDMKTLNGDFAKVRLPIFAINGKHDAPVGEQHNSVLDVMNATRLVNYVGKREYSEDVSKYLQVNPLILQKGQTKVALFPFSYVPEYILSRLDENEQIIVNAPFSEDTTNIFVLHQQRENFEKNLKKFIPEFMDVLVWGYEHDCDIDPRKVSYTQMCQPGSTIRTHFDENEQKQKHVTILSVNQNRFTFEKVLLHTLRPFVFDSVHLRIPFEIYNTNQAANEEKLGKESENLVVEKIESMMEKALDFYGHEIIPLVHLVVHYYTREHLFNRLNVTLQFENRVANMNNLISFVKEPMPSITSADPDVKPSQMPKGVQTNNVQNIIKNIFEDPLCAQKLQFLKVDTLGEAVGTFIDGHYNQAFDECIDREYSEALTHLTETSFSVDDNIDNDGTTVKMEETVDSKSQIRKVRMENVEDFQSQDAISILLNEHAPIKVPKWEKKGNKGKNVDDDSSEQMTDDESLLTDDNSSVFKMEEI